MMPQTDEVSSLVKELDTFYELVNIHTGEPVPNGYIPSQHTTSSETEETVEQSNSSLSSTQHQSSNYDSVNGNTPVLSADNEQVVAGSMHLSNPVGSGMQPDLVASGPSVVSHKGWF